MKNRKIIYKIVYAVVVFFVALVVGFFIGINHEEKHSTEIELSTDKNIENNGKQNEILSDINADNSEKEEMISVENAWQNLRDKFFKTAELNEISYDNNNKLKVVTYRGEAEFSNGEEVRPCESVVFYNHQEEDEYIFGNYMVFYDGDDIYGTKTRGWYSVNVYTGDVMSK